jgi:hypothetical protein
MPIPIHVDEYSGHTPNQRPRSFTLDERLYEIAAAALDQCYEPSATCPWRIPADAAIGVWSNPRQCACQR